jgi:hypothetical protein
MIEGSGSASISLTYGSVFGRPKNIWIPRIRIRNTNKKFTPLTSGTIRTDYFLVSQSTAICFLKCIISFSNFESEIKFLSRKNASNPLLLGRTACINVCAQAVHFPVKPVSKKCANHTFYVRRTVRGLRKGYGHHFDRFSSKKVC